MKSTYFRIDYIYQEAIVQIGMSIFKSAFPNFFIFHKFLGMFKSFNINGYGKRSF